MKKPLIWTVGDSAVLGASLAQAAPAQMAQIETPGG